MSEKVLGFNKKDILSMSDTEIETGIIVKEINLAGKLVSVRLASESVDKKEYKRVLEENKILKQALKYVCSQNNINYDSFWKRIKPDKWRDYLAKVIKTE